MFKNLKILANVRFFCSVKFKPIEMKYLNVAEKHDAAKTISALLSKGTARRREGYSVYNKVFDFDATIRGQNSKMVMTSVSGHLLHLEFLIAYKNWNNCDPSKLFDAPVRKGCSEDYQPIKRTLEREIKSCQGLIIWTDCDREGENIGFEIIDVCRAVKPNITVYRAKFSEITSAGIRRALANLAQPDKRQSDAVDIRTELDLRTGAALTRFQTMRLQRMFPQGIADKLISYGSCQIPTLGFVAERYKEVEAFISEPFWKIKVTHTIEDLTVEFNWARTRLFDKDACEDFLMICLSDPKAKVESVTTKPKNKWRPIAMDTVEMEKLGSRKLKLSAKETMTIAEKLYTQGLISYPRTETNSFSSEINLKSLVEQQLPHPDWGEFASRIMEWGTNPRNGNKSDQAHPPIHPTKFTTGLSGNEARVYELIVRHFLACVSKDATGSETIVNINIAGEKFSANGLCIFERNYLDVYPYDKWNAKLIHKYETGQEFDPTEISMQEGATTAPPLLTEADLIALMEKHGIGTDATHAEHINTIKERGYIGVVERGCLVPGVIGMGLYEGYDAMQLTLAKPVMRAEFEADLKKICEGQKNPQDVLREQIVKYKEAYKQITEKVSAMDEKISSRINETPSTNDSSRTNTQSNENQIQELFKCPKCQVAQMSLRKKKDKPSYFIGCLNYPSCKHAIWLPDDVKEAALSTNCSRCGVESKKIRLKFSTAYFRALFNVPTNEWYVACLRCDSQLREALQINLDSVKATGAIVGDSTGTPNRNGNSTSTGNNISNNSHFNGSSNSAFSNPGNSSNFRSNNTREPRQPKQPKQPKPPKPPKAPKSPKQPKAPKPPKPPKGPKSKTISLSLTKPKEPRSGNNVPTNSRSINTAAATSNTVQADWFREDDGFDGILLETDFDRPSVVSTENVEPLRTTTTVASSEPHLNGIDFDDWPDESNDINFEDYEWGTSNTRPHQTEPSTSNNWSSPHNEPGTSVNWPTELNNDDDFENYEWGTSNRRSNPPAKRTRTEENRRSQNIDTNTSGLCSALPSVLGTLSGTTQSRNDNRNSFKSKAVGWGTSSGNEWDFNPTHQERSHDVKCTGCHILAKELTVKKDGPNKGRIFYTCSKPKPCTFFQWADEEAPTEQLTSNFAQPRSTNIVSNQISGNNGETTTDAAVKCKCDVIAKSLTVRKDGPNKGRPFFACANQSSSCGFFQWGDENTSPNEDIPWGSGNQPSSSKASSWGSNKNPSSSNFTAVNRNDSRNKQNPADNKKRKCGLCRLEGHIRSKCPRKGEFDM